MQNDRQENNPNVYFEGLNSGIVQTPEKKLEPLKKDEIKGLKLTLKNIVDSVERACHMVKGVKDQNLLICIGNTGCGKSTLLAALIYGTSKMKIQTIEKEVSVPTNKKVKKVKQFVIQCIDDSNVFKIGHSSAQSETFIPNIFFDAKTGITYTDVAGLNDTSGELIEIVNNFVVKFIFKMAKQVRFIIPITHGQIKESRGSELKNQLDTVLRMSDTDLQEMQQSIQPVITQVKTSEDGVDIDDLRNNFQESLQTLTDQMKNRMNKDDQEQMDRVQAIADFYYELSEKLEIFDPLDREIMGDDDQPQNIKTDDLRQRILKLEPVSSRKMNAPLTKKTLSKIVSLLDLEQAKCYKIFEEFVKQAEKQGKAFTKNLSAE